MRLQLWRTASALMAVARFLEDRDAEVRGALDSRMAHFGWRSVSKERAPGQNGTVYKYHKQGAPDIVTVVLSDLDFRLSENPAYLEKMVQSRTRDAIQRVEPAHA